MFCRGCRGVRSLSSLRIAARLTFLPPTPQLRNSPRSASQNAANDLRISEDGVGESVGNLDTVPGRSVDPRTQEARPGSNWTYSKELFALARRIGHDLSDLPKLQTALNHRSALTHSTGQEEEQVQPGTPMEHNSRLSFLGRTLIQYFVTEHLLSVYPHMQAETLADVSNFLLNDDSLVRCADHIGVTDLIRTRKRLDDPREQKIIVRALFAIISCIHLDRGPAASRRFVTEFVASKMAGVDLHEVIKLQHPRYVLRSVLASQGLPRAESRLLKETGRATHFPTFVVGVYSGEKLLGEGCGTSLKRAEREAVVAALHTHFTTQLASLSLPPEGYEREEDIEFFQQTTAEESSEQNNM